MELFLFPPREAGLAVIHFLPKCLAKGEDSPGQNVEKRNVLKKDELKRRPERGQGENDDEYSIKKLMRMRRI